MLIIKFEEFKENFKNILSLTFELGVTFLTFLYMENGDIEKFYKFQMNSIISIILFIHLKIY